MKILMLGWELPPHHSGGLGVACYQLCKALSYDGFSIDFVLPYHDKHENIDFMNLVPATNLSAQEARQLGGAYDSQSFGASASKRIEELPNDLRGLQAYYTRAMQEVVSQSAPEVIHAHDWLTFEAATEAKKHSHAPMIAHVHATEFDRSGTNQGNPIIHDIEYNGLLMADRIVAVSQATKEIISREYDIPANKIDVVHNSVDVSEFTKVYDNTTFGYLAEMKKRGYKVVVNLGRLTIQKGLTHLLRAAQLVVERDPKVLFLICGTGDQYHELLELSADLGIAENIFFTGTFVRGKAWSDAYDIGDMFIMPSVSEPFGIAPLEAIGHGTPALVSKQSGVSEVIRNMLLFDYWDHARMADQILAMANYDALPTELYANARREFDQLSWSDVAQKCRSIYKQLAASKGGIA